MAVFPRGRVWWYKFYFAGQLIRESAKSTSKTVAKDAENQRRRELEQGFHNLKQRREIRIRLTNIWRTTDCVFGESLSPSMRSATW